MGIFIEFLFGKNSLNREKLEDFEIQPKMNGPDEMVMDMDSFFKSEVVKRQLEAAKKIATKTQC